MMATPVFLITQDAGLLRHWQKAAAGYPHQEAQLDWPETPGALALLDIDMNGIPDWGSPWWAGRTRSMRVVALSTTPSDEQGFAALSAGCTGYCHAVAAREQLTQVLAVVATGGIWAGRNLVQRLLTSINQLPASTQNPDLLMQLTSREREVAKRAAKGAANKTIARELGISERTVKAHLSASFEKLQLADRVQLALRVNGIE